MSVISCFFYSVQPASIASEQTADAGTEQEVTLISNGDLPFTGLFESMLRASESVALLKKILVLIDLWTFFHPVHHLACRR